MVRKTDKAAFKGVEDRVVSYKTPEGLVKVIHINPDTPVDGSQDSIRYHVLDFYLDNNKDSRKYEQREWNHLIDSGLYDKIFELKERQAPFEELSMLIETLSSEIPDDIAYAFDEAYD